MNDFVNNHMHYPNQLSTLADFYDAIYAISPRSSRHQVTPRAVTEKLLAACGHPQKSLSSVLITGSKGKGSSAIMLSALLQGAGKKVGLFSSPHLFDYRERMTVDNQLINTDDLLRLANQVFDAANQLVVDDDDEYPRFFEITTVIAYLYFLEKKVDYAVIETGIGAMTDATNQGSHILSILTNIEAEHIDVFGSIEAVAMEKSGVMLPNVPLVLGDLSEEIDQCILSHAVDLDVAVTRFKPHLITNNNGFYSLKVGQSVWITDSQLKAKNAWIALRAFDQLVATLSDEEKVTILENTPLWAREEVVTKQPLIIIDGAHTAESAKNLRHYADKLAEQPIRKLVVLVSFSAKKNIKPVMQAFSDADKVVITQATEGRSLPPKKIKNYLKKHDILAEKPNIKTRDLPIDALEKILSKLKSNDVLVITGSVYLAGLMSQHFRR